MSFRIGCSLVVGCEKGSGLLLREHEIKLRYLDFVFKKIIPTSFYFQERSDMNKTGEKRREALGKQIALRRFSFTANG